MCGQICLLTSEHIGQSRDSIPPGPHALALRLVVVALGQCQKRHRSQNDDRVDVVDGDNSTFAHLCQCAADGFSRKSKEIGDVGAAHR